MTLPAYGVLVGTLDHFTREDQNNFGSWYHGKLYVDAPAGLYECAVDVSTPSGIKVQYRVVPGLDQTLFASVMALADGWHLLARTPTSGAIDYLRSDLLHPRVGCLPIIFSPIIDAIVKWLNWQLEHWTDSTGNNALDQLEGLLTPGAKVFVFGAPYTNGLGVHDIHYNQGDPPGQFQHLDGMWQDGGTIVRQSDGSHGAFLSKFETQSLKTDNNGLPV